MRIIETITNWVIAIRDAKNAGIINDAGTMQYFRNEYKKDPLGAYEYWISNHSRASDLSEHPKVF